MVKATFLTPAGFIGHAPLSEVRSNALICMGAHVADVCVTVTSTAKHNGEKRKRKRKGGAAYDWLGSVVGGGPGPANCLLAMI